MLKQIRSRSAIHLVLGKSTGRLKGQNVFAVHGENPRTDCTQTVSKSSSGNVTSKSTDAQMYSLLRRHSYQRARTVLTI